MDWNRVLHCVVIGVAVVSFFVLIKLLFFPNPLDVLVILALLASLFCLIKFNGCGKC